VSIVRVSVAGMGGLIQGPGGLVFRHWAGDKHLHVFLVKY
jgi:hypothetical protein